MMNVGKSVAFSTAQKDCILLMPFHAFINSDRTIISYGEFFMTEVDKELRRIEKDRKILEHEIETKKKIYANLEELKQDQKALRAVESDLHPTKAKKIAKTLGKALGGLKKGKNAYMETYKARHQTELHAVHRRKMNEVA